VAHPARPTAAPANSPGPVIGLLTRQGPGFCAANAALLMMLWGLGRPALWLDESASAVATARSWSHLWLLLQGTDAPLVPYYLLLKAQKTLAVQLFPAAGPNQELLLRWPSAVAIAIALWVLVSWLRAIASLTVAGCSGTMLLLMVGVSRYGQEARPYALVLMLSIVTTALWWRMIRTSGPAAAAAYAAAVAALVCLHPLAASLVLAHLIARLLLRPQESRRELLLQILLTISGATAGLLVASPLTFAAVVEGAGASQFPTFSPPHLLDAFTSLLDGSLHPDLRSLAVLLLAGIGLTHWNDRRYGDVTRVAATWAVVPILVLVPAMTMLPNLLLPRYLLFIVPGWAVLAGLGVQAIAAAVQELTGSSPAARRPTGAAAVTLGTLIAMGVGQWPALVAVRTPAGHGEDVRPALAQLDRRPYRALPIAVTSRYAAIELGAYAPALADRVINVRRQNDQADIWPETVAGPEIKQALLSAPAIVLLARHDRCGPVPGYLTDYRMTPTTFSTSHWSLCLLRRMPEPELARSRRPGPTPTQSQLGPAPTQLGPVPGPTQSGLSPSPTPAPAPTRRYGPGGYGPRSTIAGSPSSETTSGGPEPPAPPPNSQRPRPPAQQ